MLSIANVSKNLTNDERKLYLSALQQESTIAYIPTFVYLGLLAVVGIPGNSLVLIVYLTKMTIKPLSIFIISMAVIDLIICEFYHLFHVWDFPEKLVCQFYLSVSALLVISSGLMLVAIAIIRYMMMCHPFKKQVTLTHAKCICSLNIFMATVASIPHGILQGKHSRQTQHPNIVGYYCQVDDSYVETKWPTLDSAFLFLLFFVTSFTVTYCYVRIGCAIRRHGKNVNQRNYSPATLKVANDVEMPHTDLKVTDMKTHNESCSTYAVQTESVVAISDLSEINTENNNNIKTNCNNYNVDETFSPKNLGSDVYSTDDIVLDGIVTKQKSDTTITSHGKQVCFLKKNRKRLIRTHLMMLTVTLVFFLGFLPYLGLNVLIAVSPETVVSLQGWSLAIFQLFLNSYLVNCAVNPVIYSLMDQKFKNICIKMFQSKH
ncbi:neurotensin receptor type 1 [Biomphalaria pfeifferi]|uniref:Neurotensin receptor type 1 n=1 Tax=Biomphalaria pfeifferi TaxID=112525 RepID=A0AAD8AZB0_BIOPF|nr:neurotensin receptor type 1 [Biomphalaria pfeifferi]